ncbi:unnamed protein product [Adineta steineri]|nr:unnamed protein product [Adineta steineri]
MKLYENYPNIIQTYRKQAELADKPLEHRTTIHLADRFGFGDDSISLENLCLERSHPDAIASVIHGQLHKNLDKEEGRCNTVAVGVYDKNIYVALNHIGKENGQEKYDIDLQECNKIHNFLIEKKILPKNHEIIFLDSVPKAKNKAECQEPHDEMQILRYWKDVGILQKNDIINNDRPIRIGASKPACSSCDFTMVIHGIEHSAYDMANMSQKNS